MRLEELFERHQAELFRFIARYTGDGDLAEDVVQETFVKLAEHPPRRDDQIRAWLYRVATNLAIDAMRGARRRFKLVEGQADRLPMGDPPGDPAALAVRDDERRRVRRALA